MDRATDSLMVEEWNRKVRKFLLVVAGALLLLALYQVCRPFLAPVSWAAILVLSAWPVHARLRSRFPTRPALTTALSGFSMALAMVAVLVPIGNRLGPELESATTKVVDYVSNHEEQVRQLIAGIPLLGEQLAGAIPEWSGHGNDLEKLVEGYSDTIFGTASSAAQGIVSFLFSFLVFWIAVFSLLYHGEEFADQLRLALRKVDPRIEPLILLVERTVAGVLYGLVFTAVAQGLLAGIGFAVAGVQAPTVLGVATVFLSFVPWGPQLIYVPVSALLVVSGSPLAGVLLALWGFLVVSSADNVLKPLFIAQQVKLPLPLALLAVVGGLLAFGVIGVFLGPVVVALVHNLWLAWTSDAAEIEVEVTPAG